MSSSSIAVLFLMIISLINAEKVCPGYGHVPEPKDCTSTCSRANDQCPSDLKCCYVITQPCGFHCIVPKDNTEKSGQCPTFSPTDLLGTVCGVHACDVDNDCKGDKKCCKNRCSSRVCATPK